MAYSSGTFSRLYDWTTDRDAGVKIRADRMDAEFDGIATALTTAVLKDGTQTTTATVPFAFGISVVDNKAVTLGTNSDYTIQYDETTRDSLMVTSNVEGAVFSMVLAADQGDDAGDEWKLGIADGGVLTIGNDINSAHTYVAQLTLTPNSTVASSTTAVAGNLTVGGSLTLGSGAVLSEAELEMLDGITAGTVAASKAMVVDANKDIGTVRNLTIDGTFSDGNYTFDTSGNVSGLGTVASGAITSSGIIKTDDATDATSTTDGSLQTDGGLSVAKDAILGNDVKLLSDSAVLSLGLGSDATFTHDGTTGLTIAATPISIDSTGELHLNSTTGDIKLQDGGTDQIAFDLDGTAGEVIMKPAVDSDDLVISQYDGTEVIRVEDNGSLGLVGNKLSIANSSSDVVIKPLTDAKDIIFQQYDGTVVATVEDDGTFNVPTGKLAINSTAITSTAAEINLIDGGTARGTTSVASGDGILINDGGTMRMTNVDTVSTYFSSHNVGGGNIVTTGALDSGSITSGFGTIDTGSSAITTTGLISGGSLDIDDVLINGTTIGHTDDTDLMTVADGLLTVAGGVTITSTDAGSGALPLLKLYRNSASPADWDYLGGTVFQGENSAGEVIDYFSLIGRTEDVTDGTEDGRAEVFQMQNGSSTQTYGLAPDLLQLINEQSIQWYQHGGTSYDVTLSAATPTADRTITLPDNTGTVVVETSSGTVLNEGSADKDFRVESNGDANMLKVDGGNNAVGIGVSGPDALLHIASSSGFQYIERFLAGDAAGPGIAFYKSRGSSQNSKTVVAENDILGGVYVYGADGSTWASGGYMRWQVTDTPGSSDMPTSIEFATTNNGTATSGVAGFINQVQTKFVGTTTTTSNSANCQVDGAGRLHTVSSSEVYKTAVEDLTDEWADKLFSLEPKFYKANTETVGDDMAKIKPDWSFYGLMAEEVEKFDPRLVTYKLTEDKQVDTGSKGEQGETIYRTVTSNLDTPVPMSVNYDRITMHLINIVKRYKTRIETLETSNADLIKRIEALEDK